MKDFNGWIYIPENIGDAINDLCKSNFGSDADAFNPCGTCPLHETCEGFNNDPDKTDAENTRAFEKAMEDAYKRIQERR